MRPTTRISLALLTALALSSSAVLFAQATGTSGTTARPAAGATTGDRFSFTLPNAPDSIVDPDRMHVVITRWSTDEERRQLFEAVQKTGPADVLSEFRATGSIGYIRWPGGLEYSLRYAHRAARPDGGSDIVLITDRPLWIWWDDTAPKPSTEPYAYTAVEIRLHASGTGEGRLADAAGVAADQATGIELKGDDQLTLRLLDVRRDTKS